MLPKAGQTAGPIGLKFFWTLSGGRGVQLAIKNSKFFLNFFFSRAMSSPSACILCLSTNRSIPRIPEFKRLLIIFTPRYNNPLLWVPITTFHIRSMSSQYLQILENIGNL